MVQAEFFWPELWCCPAHRAADDVRYNIIINLGGQYASQEGAASAERY